MRLRFTLRFRSSAPCVCDGGIAFRFRSSTPRLRLSLCGSRIRCGALCFGGRLLCLGGCLALGFRRTQLLPQVSNLFRQHLQRR